MFKNVIIYKFQTSLAAGRLNSFLSARPSRKCLAAETMALGWALPLGDLANKDEYVASPDEGKTLFVRLDINERLLPASVVKEAAAEKVSEIENKENRKLTKKEKKHVKEDVFFQMVPRAFLRTTSIDAMIDVKNNRILIDTASSNKAEMLLMFLRSSLENEFSFWPIQLAESIPPILTKWCLVDESIISPWLRLGGKYSMTTPEGDKSAKFDGYRGSDALSSDFQQTLRTDNKLISELSLEMDVSFGSSKVAVSMRLDDEFRFKQLSMNDQQLAEENDDIGDLRNDMLAILLLFSRSIGRVIDFFIHQFGGEAPDTISEKSYAVH